MCDHQSHFILVDSKCPLLNMLDILINSAGFDIIDGNSDELMKFRRNSKLMKYQKKLTHLTNVI